MQSLLDLAEWEQEEVRAEIVLRNKKKTLIESLENKNIRSTTLKSIKPSLFPEISKALLDLIPVWNKNLNPINYCVKEMQYLKYSVGDHFTKHKDQIVIKDKDLRIFSTSTIISKTSDLKGGDFQIWTPDESYTDVVNLEVGETLFFDSEITPHQVHKVTCGTREVLVSWIYIK